MKYGLTIPPLTTIFISWTSECRYLCLLIPLLLFLQVADSLAQPSSDPPLIEEIRFSGTYDFPEEILRGNIRTTRNRRFLGIQGFKWWLWLYRVGESGRLGSRLSRAFLSIGEPPSLLNHTMIDSDIDQLRIFFEREGYLQSDITSEIEMIEDHVIVTFHIVQGPATVVSHISYSGLERLDPPLLQQLVEFSLYPPLNNQPLLSYKTIPQRFREGQLIEERRRLLNLLQNLGYATVTRDSIRALVTPVASDSFQVEIRIRPGERYRFGPIYFNVDGPESSVPVRMDTLSVDTLSSALITSTIQGDRQINTSLLTKSLHVTPGNWYNWSEIQATKRRLESTGVFTFTNIVRLDPDHHLLPHRIFVRSRPRHQFLLSSFVRQSNDGLSDVANELGGGLGLTYENANLFGNGEVLSLNSTGSIAADIGRDFLQSTLFEVSATVRLPYLTFPLRRLISTDDLIQTRTQFSFTYLTTRREDLNLIIRGRASARIRFELQHTEHLTSFIDLLDLSLSQPDTLRGFENIFQNRILGTEESSRVIDPVQRAQIIEDYTQPQINNAIRYTLRSEKGNPLRKEDGYSFETSIELGGTFPYLLDRFVFTPGTQEQSLRLFSFVGSESEANYRQYVRLVSSYRKYSQLSSRTVLATKILGGWSHPIGKSTVIPFTHRFYSGGASSVRGWTLRGLGPGSTTFRQLTTNQRETNLLGGDIKLEASVELRRTIIRERLNADWIFATFTDAGNVWFGPRNPGFSSTTSDQPTGRFVFQNLYKEIGVGWGVGLRASWAYLVARFDLAVRVYDPADPNGGLFPTGLNEWIGYFRLGHAF